MGEEKLKKLLQEQLALAEAARAVLNESYTRAAPILATTAQSVALSAEQRETLEALTARFSRFGDFLLQRLFRTLDEYELTAEGSLLDRLNRFEKRGIIASAADWRQIRELRNEIAHEYLIEKSDRVVSEAFQKVPTLFAAFDEFKRYVAARVR